MNEARIIHITLLGKPIPLQRPRLGRWAIFDPQRDLKTRIKNEISAQKRLDKLIKGPVSLEVIFHIPFPKSLSQKKKSSLVGTVHFIKPDFSNMLKFIEDCCTRLFYKDDCQIAVVNGKKIWAIDGKTELIITEIKNEANLQQ